MIFPVFKTQNFLDLLLYYNCFLLNQVSVTLTAIARILAEWCFLWHSNIGFCTCFFVSFELVWFTVIDFHTIATSSQPLVISVISFDLRRANWIQNVCHTHDILLADVLIAFLSVHSDSYEVWKENKKFWIMQQHFNFSLLPSLM